MWQSNFCSSSGRCCLTPSLLHDASLLYPSLHLASHHSAIHHHPYRLSPWKIVKLLDRWKNSPNLLCFGSGIQDTTMSANATKLVSLNKQCEQQQTSTTSHSLHYLNQLRYDVCLPYSILMALLTFCDKWVKLAKAPPLTSRRFIGILASDTLVFFSIQPIYLQILRRQSWVNVLKLMSVGPVGPRGGIYPIIDDVVCKVNFQKLIWRPNINGYMQLCLCLWALSGPEVGYIQVQKMFCAESIFEKWFGGQTIVDICSSAFVCGPCRAWWWDIFNYRLCCVQSLFSDGPSWPCNMLTKWELDQWHIDQVRSWTTGNLTKNFSTTSTRHLPMGTVS